MLTRRDGHTPAKLDPPECWLLQSLTPGARWQPQSAGELGYSCLDSVLGDEEGAKIVCASSSSIPPECSDVQWFQKSCLSMYQWDWAIRSIYYVIVASLIIHFLPFPFFTFSSLLLKSSVYHPNKTLPWKFFLWSVFITSHTLHHFSFIWYFWQVTST